MKLLSLIMLALVACVPLYAIADHLKDCDGCKDHPMLARYPGAILLGADQKAFEEAALPIGIGIRTDAGGSAAPKTLNLTGKRTRLFYYAPPERSALEVFANYSEALEKSGMATVWTCADKECGEDFVTQALEAMHMKLDNTAESSLGFVNTERPRYLLAKLARAQGDVFVVVMAADKIEPQQPAVYVLIIESKPMEKGLVTAAANALENRRLVRFESLSDPGASA